VLAISRDGTVREVDWPINRLHVERVERVSLQRGFDLTATSDDRPLAYESQYYLHRMPDYVFVEAGMPLSVANGVLRTVMRLSPAETVQDAARDALSVYINARMSPRLLQEMTAYLHSMGVVEDERRPGGVRLVGRQEAEQRLMDLARDESDRWARAQSYGRTPREMELEDEVRRLRHQAWNAEMNAIGASMERVKSMNDELARLREENIRLRSWRFGRGVPHRLALPQFSEAFPQQHGRWRWLEVDGEARKSPPMAEPRPRAIADDDGREACAGCRGPLHCGRCYACRPLTRMEQVEVD